MGSASGRGVQGPPASFTWVSALLDQRYEALQERGGARRATGDVKIDGNDLRHTADACVSAGEDPPIERAIADGHDPLRVGRCAIVRSSASRKLSVTGPVTSSTSAWRGEATKRSPNRSRS